MRAVLRSAVQDMTAGLRMRGIWTALAAEDIGDAHRRTLLGPLWLLLNFLLFAGTFVIVFGRGQTVGNYGAYVAIGLLVWLFISETISQSVNLFVREESFVKGTDLPISVYVMRQCTQSVIRTSYAAIGALGILLFSGTYPALPWLWSLAGVAWLLVTAPAVVVLFAVAGVILPDLQFVVSNLMRLGLFLTPIFWSHEGGSGIRTAFYHVNPFTHYLAIVRAPILDGELPVAAWGICLAISVILWLIAIPVLGKYRKQIVFLL